MALKVNKVLIGAFVLGAIALTVIGIVIFGSGKYFEERTLVGMYFEGSVKGLSIGSPVMFRGVTIGSVTDVQLHFNVDKMSANILVLAEINPEKIIYSHKEIIDINSSAFHQALIDKGFRAQLQVQSFVTGQLMVGLDFHHDTPAKLIGLEGGYGEVPTIPTPLERLEKTLANIPFDEMINELKNTVNSIEKIVSSPEIMASLKNIRHTTKGAMDLIKNINNQIEPLVTNANNTLDDTQMLLKDVGTQIKIVMASLKDTLDTSRKTIAQAEKTLTLKEGASAELIFEIRSTLRELSEAGKAIRYLAEYLERHPESLIRGKRALKGE